MARPFLLVCIGLFIALLAGCSDSSENVLEASGTIEGTDIDIGSEVGGRVVTVGVEEGALVEPGDTLVVIDDTEYQLQLRQSLAAAKAADAQYRLARRGARMEDIVQAEASLKAAEADYQRMKDLLATETVTQKQFDDTEARYITAQQLYRKLSRGSRPEEIQAARALRDQAVASADYIRKKIDDCRITAPSSGTVTLRSVEPGELVSRGVNLVRITHLEKVKLTIYVNAIQLGKIRLGQEAEVRIDAYDETPFVGRVIYTSPVAEFTPKNIQTKEERTKLVFAVRIEVLNPDGVLKPGLPADATLQVHNEVDG
jgi:HlyD family secretion protein